MAIDLGLRYDSCGLGMSIDPKFIAPVGSIEEVELRTVGRLRWVAMLEPAYFTELKRIEWALAIDFDLRLDQ